MNIAMVVHDFDPCYGQGRYAVEVAKRLAGEHDFHIYANTFGVPLEQNWTFHQVPACRKTAVSTVLSFVCASESLLRLHRHDIIHAQGLSCWHADVVTAHICNAARAQQFPPRGLKAQLFPRLVVPMERRFYRQRERRKLIAVSRCVGGEIARHYQWSQSCDVIYHGTDVELFRPARSMQERNECRARYQLKEDAWVWLFVGEASKGLRQIVAQMPHFSDSTLLVISRSNLGEYQQLAAQLGVNDRIRWWGPETQTALAYRAADVFIYPSGYDAFGLVVAEAMATELPVIVGRTIGAAEWIEHGRNGWLCDPQRDETLRETITYVRNNPLAARAAGGAARATVNEHSWQACAQATEAVYRSFQQ